MSVDDAHHRVGLNNEHLRVFIQSPHIGWVKFCNEAFDLAGEHIVDVVAERCFLVHLCREAGRVFQNNDVLAARRRRILQNATNGSG